MSYLPIEKLLEDVEAAKGSDLTEEERAQLELWRKGRDLAVLVNHPGWQTVLEMLQQYATESLRVLMGIRPGENERALAGHAVSYALNDLYSKFRMDVDEAIKFAKSPPEVLRRSLRSPAPPEALL